MPENATRGDFAPHCLAIELELGREDGRIHHFAGVREDSGEAITFSKGDLNEALARLDALAKGAAFVLGHNLIAFDLPHLQAAAPSLKLLQLPVVDTLRLNPLAFPRHPYHRLLSTVGSNVASTRRKRPDSAWIRPTGLAIVAGCSSAIGAVRGSAVRSCEGQLLSRRASGRTRTRMDLADAPPS